MKIGRRKLIRTMGLGAGAWLLGPLTNRLVSTARGIEPTDKCFVTFIHGCSFRESRTTLEGGETGFRLSPIFEPLEAHREKLLILKEFYNPHDRHLHGNGFATLSVRPSPNPSSDEGEVRKGPPGGVTLDRLIAKQIGGDDAISSINLALWESRMWGAPHHSGDERGVYYPAEHSPFRAYERFFGSAVPDVEVSERLERDESVLDFMTRDVRRLSRRLAPPERESLDYHLESIRSLERRLGRLRDAAASCSPDDSGDIPDEDGPLLDRVRAYNDIVFTALSCGLTHVALINLGRGGSQKSWHPLTGSHDTHHHHHHDGLNGLIDEIDYFVCEQVADLYERLETVPVGDGSLADRSLLMWMNAAGGEHHRGHRSHPVVLLGSAGGYLRTGRYLTYPRRDRCISDVFVTAANAMGVDIDTFGDPDHCTGPIEELVR